MAHFGMDESTKSLSKSGYKEDPAEGGLPSRTLGVEETKVFRMLAARLNFMAQDNPAIQFAAKEVCRRMAHPVEEDFRAIKRLVRYIVGIKAVRFEYPWQEARDAAVLHVFADSDWAGCIESRRSTTGGLAMLGRHPVRTWATTQTVVALSSAEAELYSLAEAASRGLGLQSSLAEMGANASVVVLTDSSAARAFASTRGLGKMRHLQIKDLWVQSLVKEGRISLKKVPGEQNPADVMTKFLSRARSADLLALGGISVVTAGGPDRAEGGC
jgi:hypothetical protein